MLIFIWKQFIFTNNPQNDFCKKIIKRLYFYLEKLITYAKKIVIAKEIVKNLKK